MRNWDILGVWDTETKDYIRTFHWLDNEIISACFSPDGNKILVGGFKSISLWDMRTASRLYTIEAHPYRIEWVYFSPDGSKLLSRGRTDKGGELKMWDIKTRECVLTFDGLSEYVFDGDVRFSPDGKKIALKKAKDFYVYEFDYDLHFPGWHDWDEGARPYLDIFLALHPHWTDDDFNNILIPDLQNRGYGWLRPEGVRKELEKISK
jgi:WD40 repeat protein